MNIKINSYILIVLLLALVLYSCQTTDRIKRTNANQIVLDEEYGKSKTVNLDEIATFEFIPLETTDKSLLDKDYEVRHIDDDNIILTNNGRCEVFFFDRAGKIKNSFDCKGAADTEIHSRITGCFWDTQKKELYLNDVSHYNRILVFNEKGKHLRTLHTEERYSFSEHIADFDEKSFLAYDEKNMNAQEAYTMSQANSYPYVLLSKTDGKKVRELPFYISKRVSASFQQEVSKAQLRYVLISGIFPFKKYGNEFIICDLGLDTLYKYSPKTDAIVPLFSKLPELKNQEFPKTLVGLLDYNDQYATFMRFVNYYDFETKKWAGNRERIVYDQQKKSFYRKSFAANIGTFWYSFVSEFSNPTLPKNTDCIIIHSEKLYEAFKERGIKNSELKRIVSEMNDDANDVLLLIYYNDH